MSLVEIAIVFYSEPYTKRGRLVQLCQGHPMFHCGLMLSHEDKSLIVAADKTHRAKFIPADLYHEKFLTPSNIVVLGETDFDNIQRLMDFIAVPYIGDSISMGFWFYIGRWLFKSLDPRSCSILAAQMARFCGFKIKDYPLPKDLKTKTNYINLTWKEYKCK